MDNNTTFNYTYSAKEQEEIKRIREKYASPTKEETSMEQLRRMDESATRGAAVVSLLVGIAGALILGIGMCCTMVWGDKLFIPGIIIGLAGIAGVSAAYPLYVRMVKKKRTELAPEIMRLTDELMR